MTVRAFTDGDVFYSEDMNRLVLASTMQFPSAAARTTTLTGPMTPPTGTLSFTTDDQATSRWTGTRWVPAAGTVMFSYAKTTSQAMPASTGTTVSSWNQNLLGTRNVSACFTPSTGVFKAPWAGWYEFTGGLTMPPATNASVALWMLVSAGGDKFEQAITGVPLYNNSPSVGNLYFTSKGAGPLAADVTVSLWFNNTHTANITVIPDTTGVGYFSCTYRGVS